MSEDEEVIEMEEGSEAFNVLGNSDLGPAGAAEAGDTEGQAVRAREAGEAMNITKKKLIFEINNRILSINQCNDIGKTFETLNFEVINAIIKISVNTYKKNLIERIKDMRVKQCG
jgi:hypothetical protein